MIQLDPDEAGPFFSGFVGLMDPVVTRFTGDVMGDRDGVDGLEAILGGGRFDQSQHGLLHPRRIMSAKLCLD
jgi:hypothetical protein